jgi:hypothetical protein
MHTNPTQVRPAASIHDQIILNFVCFLMVQAIGATLCSPFWTHLVIDLVATHHQMLMFTLRILTSLSLGFFVHNAGRHERHQYFASGLGICTVDMGAIQWSTHEDVHCGFFTPTTTTFSAVFRDFSILDAYFISLIRKCIAFYFGDLAFNALIVCCICLFWKSTTALWNHPGAPVLIKGFQMVPRVQGGCHGLVESSWQNKTDRMKQTSLLNIWMIKRIFHGWAKVTESQE